MPTPRFDRLCQVLLSPEQDNLPYRARVQQRAAARQPRLSTDAEIQVEAALAAFHEGRYGPCLKILRPGLDDSTGDLRVATLLAACEALGSGRLEPGIETCAQILGRALYVPDVYCALGDLLLRAKRRSEARVVLHNGLRVCPRNPRLEFRLRKMGVRRLPVLQFLPRSHPANRFLGRLRSRVMPTRAGQRDEPGSLSAQNSPP